MSKIVMETLKIREYEDFNKLLDVKLESGTKKEFRQCYLQKGDMIAIAGYRTLEGPAVFTTSEEMTLDSTEFVGMERAVFTGLKQRAVIRRVHSDLIRSYVGESYKCAVPDNLCSACSNCFLFGALNPETGMAVKSRINIATSYSTVSIDQAMSTDEEFHIMVHTDLSMEKGKEESSERASIYTRDVIKAGTVFPFVVYIYSPTVFDLSAYIKAHLIADKKGYGNYATVRGPFISEFLGATRNIEVSPSVMLEKNKKELLKLMPPNKSIIGHENVVAIAEEFNELAKKYLK